MSTYIVVMPYKYKVGDKVRVVNHKYIYGAEGEIEALMPFAFAVPAYDVRIGSMIVAVSERSLEKVEETHTEVSTIDER